MRTSIIKDYLDNKSNHFLSVLVLFIFCNYPGHDLGIDKVFYLLLLGYPIFIALKCGLKSNASSLKLIYLIITLLLFLYAFFLPNQYALSDLILYLKSFSQPIIFLIYCLYIFFAKVSFKEIKKMTKLLLYFGLFLSFIVIFFKIFPNLYIKGILPFIRVSNKEEILDNMSAGYGIPIGGSLTYPCIVISLCLFICFAFEFLTINKSNKKLRVFEFIYFTAVFCSGRRTEVLCLIVSLFILYIATIKTLKLGYWIKFASKMFIVCLIGSLIIFGFSQLGLIKRFTNTANSYNKGSSINSLTSGRIFLWALAFNNFLESPIVGKGWAFFPNYSYKFVRNGKHLNVHNTYLQLLCETGIVGTIFMGIPFIIIYLYTFRLFRKMNANNLKNNKVFIMFLCLSISFGMQTFYFCTSFMDNHFYKGLFCCILAINIILTDFVKQNLIMDSI